MTPALDYASPTTRPPPLPLWQRLTMIPLYYLGWTVGCAVWLTYLAVLLANVIREGSANVAVLYPSLALGGIAGAALAYLARRRRWPQWLLLWLGLPATGFAVYAVVDMYQMPRGIIWEFFFRLVLVLLAGAIGLLLAGFTGLMLSRRR
jgi:hypothetical protein